MDSKEFLYRKFLSCMGYEPTACQDRFLRRMASFSTSDDGDILVVNGYAGTGKTTAVAAVITALSSMRVNCVLLAPTGRSAKVLSSYTGRMASTIHRHIYRAGTVGEDGTAKFSLVPNKAKDTVYFVDEVSLIGIEQGDSVFGAGNLLEDLIRYVRSGSDCRLVMIGDSAQLPPVGLDRSPALSKEYMSFAGGVDFITLTTVVRQQVDSGILLNATRVRDLICSDSYSDIPKSSLGLVTNGLDDVERIGGGELIDAISSAFDTYGEDQTVILCRSNRRANRYNAGVRSQVLFHEESLVRGEKLMIVKNCYHFLDDVKEMDFIANGDIAKLLRVSGYSERYGLHFADARLSFPDYGDIEIKAKICLDTLESESPSLDRDQQNALFRGSWEDYSHLGAKGKIYKAMKEDPFFNALQIKYASAITCHKSQGGQWDCVFIDNALWQDALSLDDLKWLYTAITRAVKKVYFVNFADELFAD
ncbi:MAG: AAA family ATPase [Bacteroidales bacterium]|nr:AAA family ATPase [Bacteroidales bacterium]